MKWDGRLVVIYSGGVQSWQALEKIPWLFKLIHQIDSRAYFVGLSPEKERLKNLFDEAGVRSTDYSFLSVDFKDIPFFLAASDIGFLIREKNIVNALSCPTKFAEYLAAGLHVISTTAVEEIAATLKDGSAGTLIDDLSDAAKIHEGLKRAVAKANDVPTRTREAVTTATTAYDWKIHVPVMKKWYLNLHNAL
jgi:glycosyltransferase involved in cell wall biosynthesis